ncbi:hypothetical protein [Shewanella benthica]|nr:hypothetical protein [Shewanella benthica]
MNQAIATGLPTSKYHELVLSYQVLKFDAAENTFNFIKDTRLQQLHRRKAP